MPSRLRTPIACAPSRSDWMPSRLRSRHEYCSSTSTAACCCTSTASDSALIRAPARGPSGIVTTSTPRWPSSRAASERCRRLVAARRHQLDERDELALRSASWRAPTSARARHRRLRVRLARPPGVSRLAARVATREARRHRLGRQRDLPDVLRRRAAAAADQPHARGDEAPRVRRHVFRRTQIEVAAFDVARLAGVGLRRQPHI